jgi:small subunit ribosomal protein S16
MGRGWDGRLSRVGFFASVEVRFDRRPDFEFLASFDFGFREFGFPIPPCIYTANGYNLRFDYFLKPLESESMSVKLRFMRIGRKNAPVYRLNAVDSRSPRDGRVIEELGFYNPREKDKAKQFTAKLDKCREWLDHGAIPSETVSSLLKKSGVEHKMLRLPKPGKPKVAAPAAGAKKEEAKAS